MSGFWSRHTDKVGVGGSIFAALCCLSFPALLALISALGLGFLIHDAILLPLLAAFLALTLYGLYAGVRRHGRRLALGIGAAGALVMLVSVLLGSAAAAGLGIAALVLASIVNIRFAATRPRADAS